MTRLRTIGCPGVVDLGRKLYGEMVMSDQAVYNPLLKETRELDFSAVCMVLMVFWMNDKASESSERSRFGIK